MPAKPIPAAGPGPGPDRFAAVGDLQIRYLRAGFGARTVVLLHDWPQSAHAWRRVIPLLADPEHFPVPDRGFDQHARRSPALAADRPMTNSPAEKPPS
jgi:pimeloyl-ACP methyl ester carboxylesterase